MKRLLFFLSTIIFLQSCKDKNAFTDQWWLIPLFFIILIPGFMIYQGYQKSQRPETYDEWVNGNPIRRSKPARPWYKQPASLMGFVIALIGVIVTLVRVATFN
jgi:hypothetical protein